MEPSITHRPDGFYWQDDEGVEYGPFATLLEAEQNMEAADGEGAPEPGETLEEAESEIGVADYVDPDTGEPAEDGVPPLEQH
jgi:hypothetical protein